MSFSRSILRAPTALPRVASVAPRLPFRAIHVQPEQPKNSGHPIPDGAPTNAPGGAERILGGIAGVVLVIGGWVWFRSASLKREQQGVSVTGNDVTKGPKEGQTTGVVG